jgi:NADP-dependent 3-hydroxy acid dehydrogenase YdfG
VSNQERTLAVIGAGPATGMSVARRFGREGYRVGLVARTPERVRAYVDELTDDRIETAGHTADARDRTQLVAALDEIEDRFGRIDAVYYGPGGLTPGYRSADVLDIDIDNLRHPIDLFLYSPIALVQRVLPGMLERGSGALLFAGGTSAKYPFPLLGGISPAGAALRNYVLTLNAALADKGVFAGTLTIGALVERSEIAGVFRTNPERFGGIEPETVDPDQIAETAWRMSVDRGPAESEFGVLASSPA